MKILFVWPRYKPSYYTDRKKSRKIIYKILSKNTIDPKYLTYPLLTALTSNEHHIEVVEGDLNDINFNEKYDLIGITAVTPTAFLAYEIADEFRKRGNSVIIGGWHPSALPEEAKKHADSVVIGEAEELWKNIIKDAEGKNLKDFYRQTKPLDASLIPHPINIYPNKPPIGVQATRGCPYGCEFCSITNTKYICKFRMRDIKDVIKDIQSESGNTIIFHDNSLTINPIYSKQLFKEMKGLNKKFTCFGNINTLSKYEELLKLASEAGCKTWAIGFESISQKTLNSIGKKNNLVKDYNKGIRKIHDHGMSILGYFVFGFDYDKLDVFEKSADFVRKSELDCPSATILTPYPGTPLYNKLEQEKRILTKDWSKYNSITDVVFKPKNMTPDELLFKVQDLIFRQWYKKSKLMFRVIKSLKYGPNLFSNSMGINISRKIYYASWKN